MAKTRPVHELKETVFCSTYPGERAFFRYLVFDGPHYRLSTVITTGILPWEYIVHGPDRYRRHRWPVKILFPEDDRCLHCLNPFIHECPSCHLLSCAPDTKPRKCLRCPTVAMSVPLNDPTIPHEPVPMRDAIFGVVNKMPGFIVWPIAIAVDLFDDWWIDHQDDEWACKLRRVFHLPEPQ